MKEDKLDGLCESYDEDGLFWEVKIYNNGAPVGEFEEHYVEGELREKESIKDNEVTEKRRHENGIMVEKKNYKNGKLHGPFTLYETDGWGAGWIRSMATYKNGEMDGPQLGFVTVENIDELRRDHPEFIPNLLEGIEANPENPLWLEYKQTYKNGKPHGTFENSNNSAGLIWLNPEDYSPEELRSGKLSVYEEEFKLPIGKYYLQQINMDCDSQPWPVTKPDGIHSIGHKEGFYRVEMEGAIKNSKLDGTWRAHYIDGQLQAKWDYENGEVRYPAKVYHPDGTIVKDEDRFLSELRNYKNGELHGPYRVYGHGLFLSEKGSYRNGKLHGPFEKYDEDGSLVYSRNYDKGQRCGKWFQDGQWCDYGKGAEVPDPLYGDDDDYTVDS